MQRVHLKDSLLTLLICSMSHYALRVDGALDEVQAWLAKYAIGGWAVKELAGADNLHWHFHLITEKTIKQLRCSFNREVPSLKGNGKYSLTECRDVEKYDRYMAKGDSEGQCPDIAWVHGLEYTEEKVSELHDEYWLENRRLKKRKNGSMVDQVTDECKRENVLWSDRAKISEIYIRMVGAAGKPINLFSIRANINSVQYQLCPDDSLLRILVERVEQY